MYKADDAIRCLLFAMLVIFPTSTTVFPAVAHSQAELGLAVGEAASASYSISLSISGGVSLGAYEAGTVSAFIRTIRALPNHPLIGHITGASAGAVNGLLAVDSWCRVEPEDDGFRDVWMAIGLESLLPLDPSQYSEHDALLSQNGLKSTMARLEKRLEVPGKYRKGCSIGLSVVITRISSRHEVSLGIPTASNRFVVHLRANVTEDGRLWFSNELSPADSGIDPGGAITVMLPEKVQEGADGNLYGSKPQVSTMAVLSLVLASAAFPGAFAPVAVEYCEIADKRGHGDTAESFGAWRRRARFSDGVLNILAAYRNFEVDRMEPDPIDLLVPFVASPPSDPSKTNGQTFLEAMSDFPSPRKPVPIVVPKLAGTQVCPSNNLLHTQMRRSYFVDGGVFDNSGIGLIAHDGTSAENRAFRTSIYFDPDIRRDLASGASSIQPWSRLYAIAAESRYWIQRGGAKDGSTPGLLNAHSPYVHEYSSFLQYVGGGLANGWLEVGWRMPEREFSNIASGNAPERLALVSIRSEALEQVDDGQQVARLMVPLMYQPRNSEYIFPFVRKVGDLYRVLGFVRNIAGIAQDTDIFSGIRFSNYSPGPKLILPVANGTVEGQFWYERTSGTVGSGALEPRKTVWWDGEDVRDYVSPAGRQEAVGEEGREYGIDSVLAGLIKHARFQQLRDLLGRLPNSSMDSYWNGGSVFVADRFWPIAASHLGNFGAFLDPSFRRHDFAVGGYEAIVNIARYLERSNHQPGSSIATRTRSIFGRAKFLMHQIFRGEELAMANQLLQDEIRIQESGIQEVVLLNPDPKGVDRSAPCAASGECVDQKVWSVHSALTGRVFGNPLVRDLPFDAFLSLLKLSGFQFEDSVAHAIFGGHDWATRLRDAALVRLEGANILTSPLVKAASRGARVFFEVKERRTNTMVSRKPADFLLPTTARVDALVSRLESSYELEVGERSAIALGILGVRLKPLGGSEPRTGGPWFWSPGLSYYQPLPNILSTDVGPGVEFGNYLECIWSVSPGQSTDVNLRPFAAFVGFELSALYRTIRFAIGIGADGTTLDNGLGSLVPSLSIGLGNLDAIRRHF